jgi:predicted DNA-binding protein (UPF0251 family)
VDTTDTDAKARYRPASSEASARAAASLSEDRYDLQGTEAEVLRLYHAEKWRIGTIAAQLGLHHTTVQRVLRQTGVELKAVVPRPSMADPFVPFLVQQLEKYPGLCASRLFEMVRERGYPGGADHFRRASPLRRFNASRRCPATKVRSTGPTSASTRSGEQSGRSGPS